MWILDALLILALLATAVGVLWSKNLYTALVLFIVFGLLMALVWMRMQAPDLALAEAAIGAGLTGVLFLDALGHLRQPSQPSQGAAMALDPLASRALSFCAFLLAVGVTGLLWLALLTSAEPEVHLQGQVMHHLSATGVESPITAVLLSFRAYDTLLEVAVILVAAVVGLALRFSQEDQPRETRVTSLLLQRMLVWLLPLMLLVAVYLMWAGSFRPGGAFQAAAVLAALAVLARMSGTPLPGQAHLWVLRAGLISGLGVFLLAGALSMMTGGAFLAWPDGWEKALILLVELALTFSLGLLLFALFEASPAPAQLSLQR